MGWSGVSFSAVSADSAHLLPMGGTLGRVLASNRQTTTKPYSSPGGPHAAWKYPYPKPAKVIERATAEACVAIAQRVAHTHCLAEDRSGWSAATQVARSIEEELLGRRPEDPP